MVVPRSARRLMRWNIVSSETGFEVLSYSLQYSQARLQRRMGMTWASTGWLVEASAFPIMRHSRKRRVAARMLRRNVVVVLAILLIPLDHNHVYSRTTGV